MTGFMCDVVILTKYVLMPQHNCLVDLRLSKPRSFLSCEEDLDGNTLVTPLAFPHLTISSFSDTPNERYLLCYRSLNLTANGNITSHRYVVEDDTETATAVIAVITAEMGKNQETSNTITRVNGFQNHR